MALFLTFEWDLWGGGGGERGSGSGCISSVGLMFGICGGGGMGRRQRIIYCLIVQGRWSCLPIMTRYGRFLQGWRRLGIEYELRPPPPFLFYVCYDMQKRKKKKKKEKSTTNLLL